MEKIKKPRGTMDIIAPDTAVWQYIEKTAADVAHRFGFGEIRTPTFEELGLFHRGVGETTDVVQKEMYTFEDKEGRVFALRPEGTASVVRAVIENGKQSDPLPLRYFYNINCFRYEKPQAGRSREFYQFGAEMFGAAGAGADYSMISLADTFIKELGITGVELHINSIGCPNCRPAYREALVKYLRENEAELCDTCKARLEQNPLRVLDCKNHSCSEIAAKAPRTVDHLCDECKDHLDALKGYLDGSGIGYEIDPHIVRGLDYYTRTVFEFIVPGIGAQSTVCGGGRYDGLMEQLGGSPMPGIGFAMGITRLILAMEQCGAKIPEPAGVELYVAPMGAPAAKFASKIVSELRRLGVCADFDIMGRSLKAQMKYADKLGAKRVLIIGDSEIESGMAMLKNMQTSEQTEVALDGAAIVSLITNN
ncbi:MAG: histidine--tRNA ligase [Ruminococcaceae bacterium]|nr:histidine--tRNA ligase [Oscillospiraceae bacterium]